MSSNKFAIQLNRIHIPQNHKKMQWLFEYFVSFNQYLSETVNRIHLVERSDKLFSQCNRVAPDKFEKQRSKCLQVIPTCGPAPFMVFRLFILMACVYGGGAGVTPGIAVCGACRSCSAADILLTKKYLRELSTSIRKLSFKITTQMASIKVCTDSSKGEHRHFPLLHLKISTKTKYVSTEKLTIIFTLVMHHMFYRKKHRNNAKVCH